MLKLRETPKAASYQATLRKVVVARLIASGTVTTLADIWAIRSQAPTFRVEHGEGSETRWAWVGWTAVPPA